MQRAPTKKAPKATRSGIWGNWVAYALLGAVALAAFGVAWQIWNTVYAEAMATMLVLVLVAGSLFGVLWYWGLTVDVRKLRALVEHTIGHPTSNLSRKVAVELLLGGQGGWTGINAVGELDGVCFIDSATPLHSNPCSIDPVLIVRDDDGKLHLFRFGDAPVPPAHWMPDNMSCKLADHGKVGPNKFINAAMFGTAKERSTP